MGKVKIAVCITSYNEDIEEFNSTMKGLLQNIREMYGSGLKLNEIVIFLINDGFLYVWQRLATVHDVVSEFLSSQEML